MKKYLAEMVGTMVLVLMGCGVAVSLGCPSALQLWLWLIPLVVLAVATSILQLLWAVSLVVV